MSFLSALKRRRILIKAADEKVYARVYKEIESGQRSDGLWAKAMARSKGDADKAKSLYITLRVKSIKDELELGRNSRESNTTGGSYRTPTGKSEKGCSSNDVASRGSKEPSSGSADYTLLWVAISFLFFIFLVAK